MTQYYYLLFLASLAIVGCQTEGQKAYKDLLSQGIEIKDDTTKAKIGDKLMYIYNFSAGVEDIYYTLTLLNSDTSVVKHLENPEFYLGEGDITGGPSAGVHVYQATKEGRATLQFYNGNLNLQRYKSGAEENPLNPQTVQQDFYAAINFPIPDSTWSEKQIKKANTDWLEKVKPSLEATIDSLMPIHVQKYAFHPEVAVLIDSLYAALPIDVSEKWNEIRSNYERTPPIHKDIGLSTHYIHVVK